MSDPTIKKKTVFAEGEPVATSTSPYEKFTSTDFEYEYVSEAQNAEKPTTKSDRQLRLQCINSAIESGAKDPERIMDLATLFWRFVKSGV